MITAKLNIDGFKKNLAEPLKQQVPFAISHAINKTMSAVRKDQIKKMDIVFDGGAVAYTKKSPHVAYSDKRDLTSVLFFPKEFGYMHSVIKGGTVTPRNKKLVEPAFTGGKAALALTKRGKNIPNKFLQNKKENSSRFFVGIPKGRPNSDSYYGLWKRIGKGGKSKRGKSRGKLKLILSLAKSSREQKPIFHSADYAMEEFNKRFFRQVPISFRYAARSGQKRVKNLRFR